MKLQGKVLIGQALQLQMSTNTILSNFFHKNYFVCHVLCINPNAKTPNKSLWIIYLKIRGFCSHSLLKDLIKIVERCKIFVLFLLSCSHISLGYSNYFLCCANITWYYRKYVITYYIFLVNMVCHLSYARLLTYPSVPKGCLSALTHIRIHEYV